MHQVYQLLLKQSPSQPLPKQSNKEIKINAKKKDEVHHKRKSKKISFADVFMLFCLSLNVMKQPLRPTQITSSLDLGLHACKCLIKALNDHYKYIVRLNHESVWKWMGTKMDLVLKIICKLQIGQLQGQMPRRSMRQLMIGAIHLGGVQQEPNIQYGLEGYRFNFDLFDTSYGRGQQHDLNT